ILADRQPTVLPELPLVRETPTVFKIRYHRVCPDRTYPRKALETANFFSIRLPELLQQLAMLRFECPARIQSSIVNLRQLEVGRSLPQFLKKGFPPSCRVDCLSRIRNPVEQVVRLHPVLCPGHVPARLPV